MAIPAAVPPPARAVVTSGVVRESYSLILLSETPE